jgi:prepilin-type N-terminal cleavage/methylation domain-containing protein
VLKSQTPQRGFTLVEFMIGLAIIGILIVAGAPGFATFLQNSHIRNAAEALQNGLTLARVEAVRRNTNVEFVLDPGNYSWTVRCVAGSATCPGAGATPSSIQSRDATEGSKVKPPPSPLLKRPCLHLHRPTAVARPAGQCVAYTLLLRRVDKSRCATGR